MRLPVQDKMEGIIFLGSLLAISVEIERPIQGLAKRRGKKVDGVSKNWCLGLESNRYGAKHRGILSAKTAVFPTL